jgi:rhodanese-related sulfurtransferase
LRRRNRWLAGPLALTLHRAEERNLPADGLAEPFALQVRGDWQAAAAFWQRLSCPFEEARALADGDEAAIRQTWATFDQLGARFDAAMVAAAKQRIENLTVDQAVAELASGETLLVDLREPEERARDGVIPGAVHAAHGVLEFYADPPSPYYRPEFDPGRRVNLHCASGGRSALAAAMMQQLGYARVAHLDGGLKAWKEAARPVNALGAGDVPPARLRQG